MVHTGIIRTKAQGFEKLPIIMAADAARFDDDQTVIGMRQGRKFQILGKYRGLDTVQVAERIISFRDKHSPDAIVVDGDGLGAGVVDQLQHRGYTKGLFEIPRRRTSPRFQHVFQPPQ